MDADVHVVPGHAAIHKTRIVYDRLGKWIVHTADERWPNLAECRFALPTRRRLQPGLFTSTQELVIHAHIAQANQDPGPFLQTKNAQVILASIAGFCQLTANSEY